MELGGTVGILTGASRGIGVYLAEALAQRGVRLALAARTEEGLKETVARVEAAGGTAIAVPTDVTSRSELEALVERAENELGPIDLLVNNAGVEVVAEFHRMDVDAIASVVTTNLIASEVLTRLVLPAMVERRRGHVVCISSISGKYAAPYYTVYASTKHGLVGFCWSLREEMRPYGIGVSVVCPAAVEDVGMWNDHVGRRAPGPVSMVTPKAVAEAAIKAIEKNKAEIVVSTGFSKFGDVFQAISPDLTSLLPRRAGVYAFLRKAAEDNPTNR